MWKLEFYYFNFDREKTTVNFVFFDMFDEIYCDRFAAHSWSLNYRHQLNKSAPRTDKINYLLTIQVLSEFAKLNIISA